LAHDTGNAAPVRGGDDSGTATNGRGVHAAVDAAFLLAGAEEALVPLQSRPRISTGVEGESGEALALSADGARGGEDRRGIREDVEVAGGGGRIGLREEVAGTAAVSVRVAIAVPVVAVHGCARGGRRASAAEGGRADSGGELGRRVGGW
jgi:hypothetical protein